MAQVNIVINDRKYRMACEDGQEAHLEGLAAQLNGYVDSLRGDFGEIGDARLTVMAGIMVVDEMGEMQRKLAKMEDEIAAMRTAHEGAMRDAKNAEATFITLMNNASERLQVITEEILV